MPDLPLAPWWAWVQPDDERTARALANRLPLLLADEPTANLDTANGVAVMELLTDLARANRTAVVVVSHDGRLANLADQVLWLQDGRLRDRGAAI